MGWAVNVDITELGISVDMVRAIVARKAATQKEKKAAKAKAKATAKARAQQVPPAMEVSSEELLELDPENNRRTRLERRDTDDQIEQIRVMFKSCWLVCARAKYLREVKRELVVLENEDFQQEHTDRFLDIVSKEAAS